LKLKLSFFGYISIIVLLIIVLLVRSFDIYYAVKNREVFPELVLAFLSSLLVWVPFCYNWYKKGKPILSDWLKFATFLYIIFNYYQIADKLGMKDVGIYGEVYVNQSFVFQALWIIFLSLVLINVLDIISLLVSKNKLPKLNVHEISRKYKIKNLKIFYLASYGIMILQFILLFSGVIGYGADEENNVSSYSFLLQITNQTLPLFLTIYFFLKFVTEYKSRQFNLYFYAYIILYFGFGLIAGMKGILIFGIVIFLIPYLEAGKSLPKKWIAPVLIFLLFLYPFNTNYRNTLINIPGISKKDAFVVAVAKTIELDFNNNVSSGSKSYSERVALLPYLIFSIEKEKEWTYYKNMERFIYLPVSIVPRAILPNKPISDIGARLQAMITSSHNSITPTLYGWAYLEGGTIFVFCHLLILLIIINIVQYTKYKNTIFYFLFYVNFLISIVTIESDTYFFVAGLIQNLFVFYIFSRFFFKKVE